MRLYQVVAQYSRVNPNGWKESGGLPTFYLRDDMQGIRNMAHAQRVAFHMLESVASPGTTFHISISESKDFSPDTIGA